MAHIIESVPEDETDPFANVSARQQDAAQSASSETKPQAAPASTPADATGESGRSRQPHGEVRQLRWWKPESDPADETHDEPEEDEEGEGEGSDEESTPARRRWDPRGSGTRPTYWDRRPDPRRSGVEWWRHLRAPRRHALYNGTALACGWYAEIPQWVTHQTAYLVDNWGALTDVNTYFWSCSVVAVGVWDYQTRHLIWPLAWLCRVPAVCLAAGVLLYGSNGSPA